MPNQRSTGAWGISQHQDSVESHVSPYGIAAAPEHQTGEGDPSTLGLSERRRKRPCSRATSRRGAGQRPLLSCASGDGHATKPMASGAQRRSKSPLAPEAMGFVACPVSTRHRTARAVAQHSLRLVAREHWPASVCVLKTKQCLGRPRPV